jgi:hypothetical protein
MSPKVILLANSKVIVILFLARLLWTIVVDIKE